MREIEFRAIKDDMSFEFAHGNGICYSPSGMPRIPDKNGMFYTCLKGTEGQYTGLKDKNGVEIYEGDIVKALVPSMHGHSLTAFVSYREGCYRLKTRNGINEWDGEVRQWNDGSHDWHSIENVEEFEVIGNIHQNPDLLQ